MITDASLVSISTTSDADNGSKKQELPRNPRYTDKRMNEVYPVRKSRFRMEYGKESSKVIGFPYKLSSSFSFMPYTFT